MVDFDNDNYEAELCSYPHQPLGVFRNGGVWPAPRYRFSLTACARWEARYIVEWILYHRSIGIEHIYIYCNDDDPSDLYEKLLPFIHGDSPFVTFCHFSLQGLQFQMYFHFLRNYVHETEWMMFLDVDEFICIRGLDDIGIFMATMPDAADAVYFNWCSFGNNGHETRPDGYVLINYIRREAQATPFTKVFIKSSRVPYRKIFQGKIAPIMHDYQMLDPSIVVFNVIADRLDRYYHDFPERAWSYLNSEGRGHRMLDIAFIAHFNIKSNDDFRLRVDRGLKGDYAGEIVWGEKTFHERQVHHQMTNSVRDSYLSDYWKAFLSQGQKRSVFPLSAWPLISQGKPATQSSTVHPRSVEQDAQSIVSGHFFGASQNHTELEDDPWWQVDLGETHVVHEVRLFNRLDGALDRMSIFEITGSQDNIVWTTAFARTETRLFGGVDGTPFIWTSAEGFIARFVRLVAPGRQRFLHLDQFELYGLR